MQGVSVRRIGDCQGGIDVMLESPVGLVVRVDRDEREWTVRWGGSGLRIVSYGRVVEVEIAGERGIVGHESLEVEGWSFG